MSVLRRDPFVHDLHVRANGLVRTPPTPRGGGILIGSQWSQGPVPIAPDAELLQSALLNRRTAAPLPVLQRMAAMIWRWL